MTMPSSTGLLRLAFDGFHQARARLGECLSAHGASTDAVAIPAAETIYWACVLDEQLTSDGGYRTVRRRAIGDAMRGARWVRNRATHALALTVEQTGGLSLPLQVSITIEPVVGRWLRADRLPPEPPKYVDAAGRTAYDKTFADRPASDPVEDIAQWFANEHGRPGSRLRAM
ncbi:hypothetical protein [Streptomyces sp. TN58]|uniref:hypothetical protein n=1 Tax=Streptomyces sp. TN58 TaxID=234612 RepID=UPI0009503C85|nr:hypothetical protein [Streptomyces sp. TN58]APU38465.1 hypothetical protein BSL84_00410 [Streptomyces sp. TN58]APU44001.1 hypothetical protein BSL84_34095 [Streptomyces sp. TN58]